MQKVKLLNWLWRLIITVECLTNNSVSYTNWRKRERKNRKYLYKFYSSDVEW